VKICKTSGRAKLLLCPEIWAAQQRRPTIGNGDALVKLHIFNWRRFCAMVRKEFIQMRRDRMTFGMMIGVPMLQLILFGYAIIPTRSICRRRLFAGQWRFARSIVWGMRNSSYFDVTREPEKRGGNSTLLAETKVQFVVEIPVDFSRKLLRGEKPDLLLEADATDPTAVGYAIAAMNALTPTVLNRDLTGPLAKLRGSFRRSIWSCISITILKTSRSITSCLA